MRSIALIANPDSGGGRGPDVAALLRRRGVAVESFGLDRISDAAASGAERLAVAGGDGTLGAVAEAAGRAGLPLAVIPTGTANDFAARHGLPADLDEACELAASGERRRSLEIAFIQSRPFVNVASAGLAPRAARRAHTLKGALGALAYPIGALRAGLLAKPIHCRVTGGSEVIHEGRAWQVSVASGGAFGGGSELRADATDGQLDVSVIPDRGRIRLAGHALALRAGALEKQDDVRHSRCRTVTVELDRGEAVNLDGEIVAVHDLDRDGRIEFRVERNGFELVVPPILPRRA